MLRGLPVGILCALLFAMPAHAATSVPAARATPTAAPDDVSQYTYADTKELVTFVNAAADLVHEDGEAAFTQFARRGSKWFTGEYYVFVYTPEGTSVFHPVEPDLVGKNLIRLRDMNGKPVIQLIADVAKLPGNDAAQWVFYLWEDQTQLEPQWKSSYIRKAVAPDGKVFLVGAGLYNMKPERVWIQTRVNQAARLLATKGTKVAFKAFLDPASPYDFLDTYVFVLDDSGHTVIDPAYPTNAGRDLMGFTDAVGMPVIEDLYRKLAHADEAWVQYLWSQPGTALPGRKLMYGRKVILHGKTYIVGSDFDLATPIWMKL